jgi:hypothetical protein
VSESILPSPSAEVVKELKTKHAGVPLSLLSAGGNHVVVRPPSREEWGKFRKYGADPELRVHAGPNLLRDCLVHPSLEAFDTALGKMPGLAEAFAGEVVELAGMVAVEKKVL